MRAAPPLSLALLLLTGCPGPAVAPQPTPVVLADLPGVPAVVERVTDGDSVRVTLNDVSVPVRLSGVDAPELRQASGPEARDWVAARLSEGERVGLVTHGRDRYRRLLADLYHDEAEHLNVGVVAAGHAWRYRPGKNDERQAAEDAALGLWADPDAQYPGDWRKAERAKR